MIYHADCGNRKMALQYLVHIDDFKFFTKFYIQYYYTNI